MAVTKKKCKQCGVYQDQDLGVKHPIGFFCCQSHAVLFAQAKSKAISIRKLHKDRQSQDNAIKADFKARKAVLKPLSKLLNEAQSSVNKYIRARDSGRVCVSCGNITEQKGGGTMEAGHYRSRGSASHLRFNLLNIWLQCARCNRFLSGNVVSYRIELINRIGLKSVEQLENNNKSRKFSVEYLNRLKRIFNKRARFYEKRG